MKHHYVDIAGVKLEYAWVGPARLQGDQRPVLIFLHEGLGSIDLWRDFPAQLAQVCKLPGLIYSRQGYGRSDPCALPRPLNYMHKEGVEVLPALINELKIERHILIGHSDGASISIIYAGSATRLDLLGAALLAPHVFVEDTSVCSIAAAKTSYQTNDLRSKLARWHGDNVDCTFWGWNNVWLDPGFRSWNIEGFLSHIQVPLFVIQGQDDEYGTLAQVEAIARHMPQSKSLILQTCGHSPHRDQPEATFKALRTFIHQLISKDLHSNAILR